MKKLILLFSLLIVGLSIVGVSEARLFKSTEYFTEKLNRVADDGGYFSLTFPYEHSSLKLVYPLSTDREMIAIEYAFGQWLYIESMNNSPYIEEKVAPNLLIASVLEGLVRSVVKDLPEGTYTKRFLAGKTCNDFFYSPIKRGLYYRLLRMYLGKMGVDFTYKINERLQTMDSDIYHFSFKKTDVAAKTRTEILADYESMMAPQFEENTDDTFNFLLNMYQLASSRGLDLMTNGIEKEIRIYFQRENGAEYEKRFKDFVAVLP